MHREREREKRRKSSSKDPIQLPHWTLLRWVRLSLTKIRGINLKPSWRVLCNRVKWRVRRKSEREFINQWHIDHYSEWLDESFREEMFRWEKCEEEEELRDWDEQTRRSRKMEWRSEKNKNKMQAGKNKRDCQEETENPWEKRQFNPSKKPNASKLWANAIKYRTTWSIIKMTHDCARPITANIEDSDMTKKEEDAVLRISQHSR